MRRPPRALAADPKWCSIRGFRISEIIVSSSHPLFGTIDHLVPRSAGGKDVKENRFPAHLFCNNQKGSHTKLD
jgi:hypothetical protein